VNTQVAVVGLGRYGGGLGLSRHLLKLGYAVKLFDILPREELQEYLDELNPWQSQLTCVFGPHQIEDFEGIDKCYLNPAVPWEGVFANVLRQAGKELSSDIECFLESWDKEVIAISGSNGKSTCFEMLSRLLPDWAAGGNRGISVFDMAQEDVPGCVLELSSFQLERIEYRFKIAALTNFSPDHLDQHGSMKSYQEAKENLTCHQRPEDVCVLGSTFSSWPSSAEFSHLGKNVFLENKSLKFEDGFICDISKFPLPGPHNEELLALAIMLARPALKEDALLQKRVSSLCEIGMQPLPYRQNFSTCGSYTVVNDSKATTPESTICAIKAFADKNKTLHLICGGKEKDLDVSEIVLELKKHQHQLYVIGEQIQRYQRLGADFVEAKTLEGAVCKIEASAEEGDVVLLSPGTSSFDQFRNYKERGQVFDALCEKYFDKG
jgi:UDP-N-acetylmuramoylalanine--D-glutamate ligase